MISIRCSAVPAYLHESAFYQSLNVEDDDLDELIQVPKQCFKEDDDVNNTDEFDQLLHIMQFWGLDELPVGVIKFIDLIPFTSWQPVAENILGDNSPLLADLTCIFTTANMNEEYGQPGKFNQAVELGRSELLDYWLSNGLHMDRSLSSCLAACNCGQLRCLALLLNYQFQVDHTTAECAARKGKLDCLRLLRTNGCAWDYNVYIGAAAEGHLHILKYAHQQGLEWEEEGEVCANAARFGHLDCLRFAHEHGCSWTSRVIVIASSAGNFACLKYALEQGCQIDERATFYAAEHGHLDCLILLHDFRAPWDANVPLIAASEGHLEMLQYLHEHGCLWDNGLYTLAAENGQLHCIQYAHEQGLLWNGVITQHNSLCAIAARIGHVGLLRYFHENGVEWDKDTVYNGVFNNHLEIVKYAITEGCAYDYGDCVAEATFKGNVDVLRYLLLKHGINNTAALHNYAMDAVNFNQRQILEFLVDELHYDMLAYNEGYDLFSMAINNAWPECVKFCLDRGCKIKDFQLEKSRISIYRIEDANLCECIKCAVQHGWQYNLSEVLVFFRGRLPLCEAFCRENSSSAAVN